MYHDNKLAVFVSHLYGDYQRQLCQGIIDQAAEYGYRTEIYCSNDGEALGEYVAQEDAILRIPDFRYIDGAVFVSGPYVDVSLREQIGVMLAQQHIPVVEIAEYDQKFPSVSLRNSELFRDMAEHLIRCHGARRICYVGFEPQRYHSDVRRDILTKLAAEQGMPFGEDEVYVCRDRPEDYAAALARFTAAGKPDAVMCYNDHVAVRFWEAAHRAGYDVPRDFAVTGCDCDEEGQYMDPPLTSITFPNWEVGAAAVTALMEQRHDRVTAVTSVRAELVLGGSCGCAREPAGSAFFYRRKLSDRIERTENVLMDSMHMVAELSRAAGLDEGMDVLEKYIRAVGDYSDFYLCLYPDWDEPSEYLRKLAGVRTGPERQEDSVLLKLALRNGMRLPECSFRRERLLPDLIQSDSDAAYIVSPVFFGSRSFGYLVRAFRDNRIGYKFLDVLWLTNTAQFLQNLAENRRLHAVSRQLESIYTKDSLTGLYNHPGFTNRMGTVLRSVEGSMVAVTMFDVDSLKEISDRFGHREGDFALLIVGQALRKNYRQEDLCARFEGDEFYVLAKVDSRAQAEQRVERVRSYLESFNKLSAKPYLVSISAGIACMPAKNVTEPDVEDLLAQADADMRRDKRQRQGPFLR